MKHWSRNLRAVVCLFACLLLCGCSSVRFLTPMETLQAPRSDGHYEGVRDALETAVGSNIVMKYPKGDDGVASYMTADLDGDGADEVLAFYRQNTEGATTRIHLLRQNKDGKWISVQDISSSGVELDTVQFADLDNDGIPEVVTGWSLYDSRNSTMALYKMSDGQLNQRAEELYTNYVLFDINADQVTEIVLLMLSADKTAYCSALNFSETDGVTLAGRVQMDGNVGSYLSILTSTADPEHPALFIDATKGTDATLTEVIYWNDGLINAFFDPATGETAQTYRPFFAVCREEVMQEQPQLAINSNPLQESTQELNQDEQKDTEAKIESEQQTHILIPFAKAAPLRVNENTAKWYLDWRTFALGETQSVGVFYENEAYHYRFCLPTQWVDKVTYTVSDDSSTVTFFAVDSQASGEELLRLRIFGKTQVEDAQSIGYELLTSDNTYIYTARLRKDTALAVPLTQISELFSLKGR